jgi:hypothetical protein
MAHRLKTTSIGPGSEEPPSSAGAAVFQGNLAEMSISTVLTLIELERRTGRLKVRGETSLSALIDLVDGAVVHAELGDEEHEPLALLRDLLHWKKGSFQFRSRVIESRGERQSLSGLLLDAMRLEDEISRK